jgi:hypothetical protein
MAGAKADTAVAETSKAKTTFIVLFSLEQGGGKSDSTQRSDGILACHATDDCTVEFLLDMLKLQDRH